MAIIIYVFSRGKQIEHTLSQYGVLPRQCTGDYPVNVLQLPQVVSVHCNRNYPQADQSAARNLETTNHKSVCGVVAVTMHPNYPG